MQKLVSNNWKKVNISEITDYINRGIPPVYTQDNSGTAVINQKCIRDGQVNFDHIRLTDESVRQIPHDKLIQPYDILINSTGTGTVGRVGQVIDLTQRTTVDTHVTIVRPKKDIIDPTYLGIWLRFQQEILESLAEGSSNQVELSRGKIASLKIILPPINIQQKIGDILSSVDEAIQKTDKIIQKSDELKNGLMNELLTKGIGHTKFKKTKIGEIPEEWKLCSILDSDIEIIDGDRGANYPTQHEFYSDGFCLFLSNRNIRNDSFDFSEPVFISEEKDRQLRKGKLSRWDVILTTRGTIGNVAIYDDSVSFEHIRINSGMLIFRARNTIAPEFLYYLLKSPFFKERYIQLGSGSAQPQLPVGSLRNLLIPIPHKTEQLEIVKQLKLLDLKHLLEIKQLDSLLALKNGLMQDIFSQKVQIL